MEVLVAVVIVVILTMIALVNYGKTIERTHWNAARTTLTQIYTGEQRYFEAQERYFDMPASPTRSDWEVLQMDDPNRPGSPVTYGADLPGPPDQFSASAIWARTGNVMTVNETRVFGGNWSAP